MLPTPNEGVGLYERGGWNAGQTGEREVIFTRTTGPREPMTFALGWTGDDGATFSAPATVTLPLNRPTAVKVAIAPKNAGAHTAILTLEHDVIPGYSHRMLMTVVAGEALNAENDFTVETKTEVPRPEMRSFFYDVPAGANALRVDVAQPDREVAVAIVRPDTRTASAETVAGGGGGRGGAPGGSARRATYVVTDPMPGVWEVRLSDLDDVRTFDAMQAEKAEPVPPTAVTLTVSAIAAGLDAVGVASGGTEGARTITNELTVTNRMASFKGVIAGTTMGGARRERPTVRAGEQLIYEIDVPEGSTGLLVRAGQTADPAADLDVYVFNCTGEECRGGQTDSDPVGDETVTIRNPAAGTWKVVIDGASIPSGSTTFDYLDVVFNPSWGSVVSADVAGDRETGGQWSTRAHTWMANALPAGRQPFTAVRLQGQVGGGATFDLNLLELGARPGVSSSHER